MVHANSFYNVKVQMSFEDENTGKVKKTNELYLVDAVSVTDAEVKVYKDFEGYSGDFEVVATVKTKIVKVL